MNFFNPYSYIGGAIILACIGGSLYYQGTQIHHWHTKYDADEKTIVLQAQQIKELKNAQSNQTKVTENNVTKVITVPEKTQEIIKEIQKVPVPTDCSTPTYSEDVTNAF